MVGWPAVRGPEVSPLGLSSRSKAGPKGGPAIKAGSSVFHEIEDFGNTGRIIRSFDPIQSDDGKPSSPRTMSLRSRCGAGRCRPLFRNKKFSLGWPEGIEPSSQVPQTSALPLSYGHPRLNFVIKNHSNDSRFLGVVQEVGAVAL